MRPKHIGEGKIEALRDIIDAEGMSTVIDLLEVLVSQMERDVITCDLNTHSFSQLAVTKSKAEGARLLLTKFAKELNNIKEPKK